MPFLTSSTFQYSSAIKLDRTKQERWITEPYFRDYSLMDSLGNRSRVLRVTVDSPYDSRTSWYTPMIRVRLLEDFGVVAFLGRVIAIEPSSNSRQVILTCRDFLDDIADRTVEAIDTDGSITAVTRSFISNKILENDSYKPTTGGDLERTLLRRLRQDPSAYSETIVRNYSQKGNYQTVTGSGTTAVGANYEYRGVKTGTEAIAELALEDPQQDLMALYYTPSPTNPTHVNHTSNPQQYPRTYWTDLTRTVVDGNTHFVTPQTAHDTAIPESADILYFGSNSKFDGLRYTFVTRGSTITNGVYAGTLQWQFWNGTAWTGFTPTADAKFGVDSGKIYGTTYWTVPTDWGKRDLASTPDMPNYDSDAAETTLAWAAPWVGSGTTLHEDVDSAAISKVDHGDDRRNTNRYWVRVYVRTGAITVGKVLTVELYTKPNLFHDFRCEDPQYFHEVWKYVHNTAGSGWTAGRDGPGGTWTALNMTGGNDGSGSPALWNAHQVSANFIDNAATTYYFGSEYPFNGVQFHAHQLNIPNYSNVKFVWQWYSNYYATVDEPWQTISGLTISANTLADPTVITTERHHLTTGDSVTITGSNSSPVINSTYTVTRISDTTFSVPVDVTTAGTAGHVVCNDRITASEAMSNTGDAAWMADIGAVDMNARDYYLDVRWDTSKELGTFIMNRPHQEYDRLHILDNYPYMDMVSGRSAKFIKKVTSKGTNSISAANPTVITSADAAGGSTEDHNLKTGDKVNIYGSNSTPSLDGIHTVTRINATTFSIPVDVTNAGTTAGIEAFTPPPSSRVLYWVRCYITTGTPTNVAIIRDVKTAPVGTLKYFDRGKEPWVYNSNRTVQGSTATRELQYCYRYDASASAGSKFTDYSAEISSVSSGAINLRIIGNTVANPTVVTTNGPSFTISSNTAVPSTVITTTAVHGLNTGVLVAITNSNSTPTINNTYKATVLSTTTFSIPVYVTSAGTQGTVVPIVSHEMTTGHKVVITNSNSDLHINGTHEITVLSPTTFSVPINVATTAGTAGTVVPEKVYAIDNGQVGDAVYFGMDEPFSAIRLNVTDALISSSVGRSIITYEYFVGEGTDNWATITTIDETADFRTIGISEITFDKPFSWKTCQPGIKEANATDQSFGKTAYYVRARVASNSGSPATSAAKISQGQVGPNYWHPGMEAGTLTGVTSVRHSDPATYGLTLVEHDTSTAQSQSIVAYSLTDKPVDFVNKVSVRGRSGAYGVALDTTSIDTYGLVKERVVDDSTLTNSLQCEFRAQALLEQLKPTSFTSFRECKIRIGNAPVYSVLSRPQLLRAGDRVNIHINTITVSSEAWLVYSIHCNYNDDNGWNCDITLFRDMITVSEPGSAERRMIRDLATRTRETANAIFQPVDKAVVSGLDFLPEGPGRTVGREEYGSVGTGWQLVAPSGGTTISNYTSEFRWTKKLYSNHNTRETLIGSDTAIPDKDLMRIEHTGINPEEDGVAQGGAGLTFIARDKRGGSGTSDFHPGINEATLYLKNSATVSDGSGLYLAHRNIFNNGTVSATGYDEWATDTPKINAEVMTGFTGFVDHTQMDSSGRFNIVLPALDSAPLIFTSWCGHEEVAGESVPNSFTGAIINLYRWTIDGSSKYTNAQMQVRITRNAKPTWNSANEGYNSYYTISGISVANPTVITTTFDHARSSNEAVWIGGSNSTPNIDGLHKITVTSDTTFTIPVDVTTTAGNAGLMLPLKHTHVTATGQYIDPTSSSGVYAWQNMGAGVMYAVIFNSGKNTTGLNEHFSQNHTNHP